MSSKGVNDVRPILLKSAIVIAVWLLSAAPSTAQRNGPPNGAPNGQPNGQPNGAPNGQPNGANIVEVIHANSGSVLEPVATGKRFYLTGDLNGDRVEDLIVVVRINGPRSALPKDVRLLNPFEADGKIQYPGPKENKYGLAIIHSWKSPHPTDKFLLIGDSPILILENSRPTSGPEAGDMKLMLRHARRRSGEVYPKTAKGAIVLMGTEVGGDSQLYWNGKTYVWEDSAED
jgi:hypothetical protein